MKILTVVGARPQFIKAATVSRAIAKHNLEEQDNQAKIEEIIVHTGQHFDANMSEVFFAQLDIPQPRYNLGISSLGHGAMTGKMLESIEALIEREQPDWVLVYGDTNSTLAGALAAAKMRVSVAHVEAGLRSRNLAMPEEINRVLCDRISSVLLCPTTVALANLSAEGFPFSTPNGSTQIISDVGDVMYDAVLYYRERATATVNLDDWGIRDKQYVLCTLHRQENTNDPCRLGGILLALREIASRQPVLLPLHPRTRKLLADSGNEDWLDGLELIEPIPYLEMQRLEMGARYMLTDSGGVQKEAYFHGVPCITLRDETEWQETIDLGWNQLTGADTQKILTACSLVSIPAERGESPYGNGTAAEKIVRALQG